MKLTLASLLLARPCWLFERAPRVGPADQAHSDKGRGSDPAAPSGAPASPIYTKAMYEQDKASRKRTGRGLA